MLRGLFNVAATLSLLLFLSLSALALLTIRLPASFQFVRRSVVWQVTSHAGHLKLDNEPQRGAESHLLTFLQDRHRMLMARDQAFQRENIALRLASGEPSADRDELNRRHAALVLAWPINQDRKAVNYDYMMRLQPTPQSPAVEKAVSIAAVLGVLALLPTLRLSLFLFTLSCRRSLHKHSRCPHCSYDLRATPTRCPECGHIPVNLSPPPA